MLKRSFNKLKKIGQKMQKREKRKESKEKKELKEKTAGGGTKKEDRKRKIPEDVLRKPQTDNDEDHDLDINYRWGMDDLVV